MASGRIAIIRTKVLELSSLKINRSNQLAHLGYRIRYYPFVFADLLFASTFPYGPKNTTTSYTSLVSTSLSAYTDLPGHHLRSTLDLIATHPHPRILRKLPQGRTQGLALTSLVSVTQRPSYGSLRLVTYCLGYSDSDGDGYDPT